MDSRIAKAMEVDALKAMAKTMGELPNRLDQFEDATAERLDALDAKLNEIKALLTTPPTGILRKGQ